MHLLLLGLFSSGKTTVGEKLAHRLGLPFYDSDQLLEKEVGCSCAAYFQQVGAQVFREKEHIVLKKIMLFPKGVLASGGGAGLYAPSFRLLEGCKKRIYLSYSPSYIVEHFPKRRVPVWVEDLESLARSRESSYQKLANRCIACDGLTPEQIEGKVIESI